MWTPPPGAAQVMKTLSLEAAWEHLGRERDVLLERDLVELGDGPARGCDPTRWHGGIEGGQGDRLWRRKIGCRRVFLGGGWRSRGRRLGRGRRGAARRLLRLACTREADDEGKERPNAKHRGAA